MERMRSVARTVNELSYCQNNYNVKALMIFFFAHLAVTEMSQLPRKHCNAKTKSKKSVLKYSRKRNLQERQYSLSYKAGVF